MSRRSRSESPNRHIYRSRSRSRMIPQQSFEVIFADGGPINILTNMLCTMDMMHLQAVSKGIKNCTRSAWLQCVIFEQRAFLLLKPHERRMVQHLHGIRMLDILPPNLKTLRITFDRPIAAGMLPPSLTYLDVGYVFDQSVDNILPHSLTHLAFGYLFDQPIVTLPPGLTHLTFGALFDQPIVTLPPGLTHLTFGDMFNQLIVLPSSLTHLTFGSQFDQPIAALPPGLTHLTFGLQFNQPIVPGMLPPSLTHLTFGNMFDQPIVPGMLPPSLTHLAFGSRFDQPGILLPPNLTNLVYSALQLQRLWEFG